jgi:hypothetical protein
MPATKLATALTSVGWDDNVSEFLKNSAAVETIAKANLRLAVWCRQFEDVDKLNPALCFIRELQVAGHHVAASTALALYKPAAASMRTVLETALYYTYFRTHISELSTLARDFTYFVDKGDLLEYHKKHTPHFVRLQSTLGLVTRLNKWYSTISAIVHGQLPGKWIEHRALSEIKCNGATLDLAVDSFKECEDIVHRLFLCTVAQELWDGFSSPAKKSLTAGLSGKTKTALRLDNA